MPGIQARACPACLATSSRPGGETDGFRLRVCGTCATIFTATVPRPEKGTDYSAYYHAGNLVVPGFVNRKLAQLVSSLEGRRRLNRWLDVGCGAGTLLDAAIRQGWIATGTEVASEAVRALEHRGLDVRSGELHELGLSDCSFDVVSMVEVVEHVANPDAVLAEAARLLRPGGALYLTTPHGRGISSRLLRSGWSVVAPPEHLQLFSIVGIRSALERNGLVTPRVRTEAVNPTELLRAIGPRRAKLESGARVESSYRLNASLSSSGTGVAFKRMVNAVLNATRLGDSIKLVAERST